MPNTSTWPSTVATSDSKEFMRCCIWCCWRVRFTKKGTWQCTNNEPLILQDDRLQLTRGLDKKGYLEKARLTPHTHSLQRHRVTVLPSVQKTWIPSYKTMVSEGRITIRAPARDAALSSIPMRPLLLPPSTFTAATRTLLFAACSSGSLRTTHSRYAESALNYFRL